MSAQVMAEYDGLVNGLTESVAYLGAPLRDLTDEQMASVAALVFMTRVAAEAEGLGTGTVAPLEQLWMELDEICPPVPSGPEFKYGDCIDEKIAYQSAMSRCREEGDKTEEECEKENAGELSASVLCVAQQVKELKEAIGRIPGRDWPDHPFPWPDIEVTPPGGTP